MNAGDKSTGSPDLDKTVNSASTLINDSPPSKTGSGSEFKGNKDTLLSMISPLLSRSLEGKERLYAHSLARELTDLYFHQKRELENHSYLKNILRDNNQVNISLFKTGKKGSEVVFTDKLSFVDQSDPVAQETLLGKLGTYYIFGLGQGNTPSFGLYELPVAEYSDMSALVYSFKSSDSSNPDERMSNQEYCVLAIFYPKRFSKVFSNRYTIKKFLDSRIKQINSIEKIDGDFCKGLKNEMLR